jgi:hypothetical protein
MSDVGNILGALPTLSSTELRSVIAASQALLEGDRDVKHRGQPIRAKPGGAHDVKKKASPTKSVYADQPDFIKFKSAEKALKAFLKDQSADGPQKLSSFKEGSADLPAPVASFFEARQCWFRRKESLKASSPPR